MTLRQLTGLLSLLLAGFSAPAAAQTVHYVREGAPSNGAGTSWTNAFPDLPANLIRGHTYYVADGTYAAHTFNDSDDGSFITIKKATNCDSDCTEICGDKGPATDWTLFPGAFDGDSTFGALTFATGHYVFDGVTGGGPGHWDSGHGFRIRSSFAAHGGSLIQFIDNPSNIRIRHVDIAPNSSEFYVSVIHIDPNSLVIANDMEVSWSYIHDNFGAPFHLVGRWNGATLEYNHVARIQSTSCNGHAEGISDSGSDNVTVRHNLWEDVAGTAVIALIGGSAADPSTNWKVHGNVFSHTGDECGSAAHPNPYCHCCSETNFWNDPACPDPEPGDLIPYYQAADVIGVLFDGTNSMKANNWEVANNSIVNFKGRASMTFQASDQPSTIQLRNNVWYCNYVPDPSCCNPPECNCECDTNYVAFLGIAGTAHTYNYFSECIFHSFTPGLNEPGTNPAACWGVGQLSGDPFIDWPGRSFGLAGELSSWEGTALGPPYDIDPVGSTRGSDGSWDRGAYDLCTTPPCSQRAPMCVE